ncbi:CBS domain containing-hemolysin-like protein [Trueperella bonasi]|uniref:CBS domain containing-hemolysin-like protein n=1 Tax=Trueperella bonasi TaxID=312286 RepID=A0ABT9NDZ0_9ACTO|nr:hemolysin family protein [Trueperella bonasi]MDP9805609.1 CBS domain containing-hemolysin-like protein [Trueperella bonasi]
MIEAEVSPVFVAVVTIIALVLAVLAGIIVQALNSVSRMRIKQLPDQDARAARINQIYDRRPAALASVSAFRNFFVMAVALGVSSFVADYVHALWSVWLITLVVATVLFMLTALVLPAQLGRKHSLKVLDKTGWFVWPLTRVGSIFVTRREPDDDERESRDERELQVMVERVSESEVLEEDERSMLQNIFELSDTIIREVMIPRTDMVTIDADETLDRALSLFTRSGFSRIPVTGESVDDLRGVLYLKDVIRRTHRRTDTDGLVASNVMREAQFVPEFMLADELLEFMQKSQNHIAFAVDEYGGIAGMVTIEDIVEEIVGEMVDEHDRAQPEVEELSPGVYRVPARLPIDDLVELFGIDFEDDDVDTVGGLLTKSLGRIPIRGSETETGGLSLTADRFGGRKKRLSTVIVQKAEPEEEGSDDE